MDFHLMKNFSKSFSRFGTLKTTKLTRTVIPEKPIRNPLILVEGLTLSVNIDAIVIIVAIIGMMKMYP